MLEDEKFRREGSEKNVTVKFAIKNLIKEENATAVERFLRRKNLFMQKGPAWVKVDTLDNWIVEKDKKWKLKGGSVKIESVQMKQDVGKLVLFSHEEHKDESWMRRDEIRKEGKVLMDEDLCQDDRKARRNLIMIAKEIQKDDIRTWVENRYLIVQKLRKEREYFKWDHRAGLVKIGEPVEEIKRKEWLMKEKKSWRVKRRHLRAG